MKILITVTIFLLNSLIVKGQHIQVNVFAEAIRKECSKCIDSKNNLVPPAKELKKIWADVDSIKNIEGKEGFSSLEDLSIRYNNISVLPHPKPMDF